MGVSFFEVMRGELTDRGGEVWPIEFQIKAEATRAGTFARTGEARITGIIDCVPWADNAALEGRIRISTFRRREIDYRFTFTGPDGALHRFSGRKKLDWRRPLESATHLFGQIERQSDGQCLAKGDLFFDRNDLGAFLASWWSATSIRHIPLNRADDEGAFCRALGERERAVFCALVPAVAVGGRNVPEPNAATLETAKLDFLSLPADARAGLRAGLALLDLWALGRTKTSFHRLDLAARRAFLETFSDPKALDLLPGAARGAIIQLLSFPAKSAHFSRQDYLDAIGHPRQTHLTPERKPRYFQGVVEPEDLEPDTVIEAEVVVVGSGAGGASVAAALGQEGIAVAIVEAGRFRRRHEFKGRPAERMRALYRNGGLTVALGTPISIPQGLGVGGTTTVNSGTCFPTPAHVLLQWQDELGFPDDFAPAAYQPYSDRVASVLQVTPATPEAVGRIGVVIARGADALGLGHGPLDRNAPDCPGRGECIFGCREGAKLSADVTWIPSALKAGAGLYVGLPMTRILRRGSRVVAIETEGTDRHGAPRRLRFIADRFILACGTVQTPVVLEENGFTLPRIGRNLSVHTGMGLIARCRENLEPWAAIPQGYSLHALLDEGIRFEGYYLPPEILAGQLPWVGERLTEWMDDFPKLAQFGFMVRDQNIGRVWRGPNGRPVIGYRASPETQRKLKKGSALLAELFLAAGAREVLVPIRHNPVVRTVGEARAICDMETNFTDFRLLGAHPLGTCAMGTSPERGVVDFNYRVFGTENLHIVDGSVVPTSLGVNPQMTIMAMGIRAGDRIAELLKSRTSQLAARSSQLAPRSGA